MKRMLINFFDEFTWYAGFNYSAGGVFASPMYFFSQA